MTVTNDTKKTLKRNDDLEGGELELASSTFENENSAVDLIKEQKLDVGPAMFK